MPTENARQFLEQLSSDASFRAKFQTLGATKAMDVVDFASAANFVFTEADLKVALQDFPDSPIINQLREQLKISKGTRPAHV